MQNVLGELGNGRFCEQTGTSEQGFPTSKLPSHQRSLSWCKTWGNGEKINISSRVSMQKPHRGEGKGENRALLVV